MDVREEIIRAVTGDREHTVIALDFDGTLSALVDNPEDSRLAPGAAGALHALAAAGVRIALITGRDAATVLRLSGLEDLSNLSVSGLYGAETWRAGQLRTLPDQPALVQAKPALADLIATTPEASGIWMEDKRLSLVLHARVATDPAAALAALDQPVRAVAARGGLEVHAGRAVLELRLPGYDKGSVLTGLVAEHQPRVVIYAGDDLGDLPAFAAIHSLQDKGRPAWAIAAGDPVLPEVAAAADLTVAGPPDLVELLRRLSP